MTIAEGFSIAITMKVFEIIKNIIHKHSNIILESR
jgi:hypothetical protein